MDIRTRLHQTLQHDGLFRVRYLDPSSNLDIELVTERVIVELDMERSSTLATVAPRIQEKASSLEGTLGVKILLDDVCASLFSDRDRLLVIVYRKGHPVVKSLNRIGRRTLKAIRGIEGMSNKGPVPTPVTEVPSF